VFHEFFVKNESSRFSQFDFSQESSTALNARTAYPYDFIHKEAADGSPALQCFIKELAKRCDNISSSTAHYVAASVSLKESWDFYAETGYVGESNEVKKTRLTDMRITNEVGIICLLKNGKD
jgi:hypothetical protein